MLAGVKVIATAHADSISTLMKREQIQYLCKQQIFDKIVLLKQEDTPCEIDKIVQVEQLLFDRLFESPFYLHFVRYFVSITWENHVIFLIVDTTLAGLIVVLMMIIGEIQNLFETIKTIFGLW